MATSASSKRHSDSGGVNPRRSVADKSAASPKQSQVGVLEEQPLYESPLKRVKRAVERGTNKRVIDKVDDLKAFIKDVDPKGVGVSADACATIVLHMRVVWTSFESRATGDVARIHLIDKIVDDDVDAMHQVLKHGYDQNRSFVDTELVTVSLFGVDEETAGLPEDGAIVLVTRMWSLKLFAKHTCQLSTSIDCIRIDA